MAPPAGVEALVAPTPVTCGVERWDVKTATDPGASRIDPAIHDTTILALGKLRPWSLPVRQFPVETTTYRVRATLTAFITEADSDYHLVLGDGKGHTMIAEIPLPACVSGGPLKVQMAAARATFDAKFRNAPGVHRVFIPVTVVGVGFFDRIHGQLGVAPNGIELHPVLSITL